jgi:hypothetical protein
MLLFFFTKSTQQRLAQYIIDFSIFQTFRWLFCLFAENSSLHLSFFRGNGQGNQELMVICALPEGYTPSPRLTARPVSLPYRGGVSAKLRRKGVTSRSYVLPGTHAKSRREAADAASRRRGYAFLRLL